MRKTKLMTLAIISILVSATLITFIHAENNPGTAIYITPGTYYDELNETNTYIWYNFTAYNTHLINVTMIPPVNADFQLELYNPTGSLKSGSYNGINQTENILYYADSDGNWSIRVSRYIGVGTYTLILAPVNYPPATPSSPSGPSSGYVYTNYTFNATTTDPENDSVYYEFDWNDSTSTTLAGPYASGATASAQHSWKYPISYYPKVRAKDAYGFWSGWSSAASLTLTQDDANNDSDAGATFSGAIIIVPGAYNGTLYYPNPTDTVDYYNFTVSAGDFIQATMTPPSDANFQLELYDPNGEIINASYTGVGQTETVQAVATLSGMWAIRISRYTGEGQYNFTLYVGSGFRLILQASPTYPDEGVTFWVDGVSYTAYQNAPVNITVTAGNHTIQAESGFIKWIGEYGWIYHFDHWSDGVEDNPRTIYITTDKTLTAVYLKSKYPIM